MSIKIGTVDPLYLAVPQEGPADRRILVCVNQLLRPAIIEIHAVPCALSISDARCLVSLLELAIRQAELRAGPGFDQPIAPPDNRSADRRFRGQRLIVPTVVDGKKVDR
jgi:hypothetical protein